MMEKKMARYRHIPFPGGRAIAKGLPVLLWVACVFLPACPSDECTDGKCYREVDPEWGTSVLFALNPSTGESHWGLDVRGETVNVLGLQNDGTSVVIEATDPCFGTPKVAAFTVSDREIVDVVRPVVSISGNESDTSCNDIISAGIPSLRNVSGVCVGIETATGDMIAINPLDNTEMWRSTVGATDSFASGNVLLALGRVGDGENVSYVVKRIAVTTGQLLWQRVRKEAMRPLGANGQFVFLMDSHPFALTAAAGDDGWTFEKDGLIFDPERDGGMLLGNILYIRKQYIIESECITAAAQ
jgi:outer membrane protein assembly factor BamB